MKVVMPLEWTIMLVKQFPKEDIILDYEKGSFPVFTVEVPDKWAEIVKYIPDAAIKISIHGFFKIDKQTLEGRAEKVEAEATWGLME